MLSSDLFGSMKPDPRRLLETKVELTMVGGSVVYEA